MASTNRADLRRINRHWHVLCEQIGTRYAGTKDEQAAADYIEEEFRKSGLAKVHQHRFEFPSWHCSRCTLRVGSGSKMRRVAEAQPFEYGVGTGAKPARGPIVYLQGGSPLDFKQDLKGKVGLLIGSLMIGDPVFKQRVVDSQLAGLLAVDARVPFDWRIALGAAPQWTDGYTVPTIGIPFMKALDIVRSLPQQAELSLKTRAFPAQSQNVIGEIVGSKYPDEVIIVSGHHDCVSTNVGAGDNGSGVVFTLETARLLAKRRPKRTIRFISYGVEEKLSVGAYAYLRSLSKAEQKRIVFVCNLDHAASHIGEDLVNVTGTPGLRKFIDSHWQKRGHPARVETGVSPYSDHFPLNIVGVPSLFLTRPNMMGDVYWDLHSIHDNLDNVSRPVMARTIETATAMLRRVADAPRMPFQRKLEPKVATEVRKIARAAYHHPRRVAEFDYERVNAIR